MTLEKSLVLNHTPAVNKNETGLSRRSSIANNQSYIIGINRSLLDKHNNKKNKISSIRSLSAKSKNDSCAFKSSKYIYNCKSFCCMTELFHQKSLIHIHNAKHRLFSISPVVTSETDDELLTQKTNECVNQIFDFLMSNSCQMELIFPLYTRSQLNN